MLKKNAVIKIGGSLFFTENFKINTKRIDEFCRIFKDSKSTGTHIIVCGGGIIAREYINAVRAFQGTEALCDIFGIELSRINSQLLLSGFQDFAYPQVPTSMKDLSIAILFNKIIAMGGLQPGQSTTSVALEVAEFIKAKECVILTDVKGIYDKDPKKFEDAKIFKHMTYNSLQKLIIESSGNKQATAGEYRIFDSVSLQILKRSNIKVIVMSGRELNEFKKYWNGKEDINGTIVSKE